MDVTAPDLTPAAPSAATAPALPPAPRGQAIARAVLAIGLVLLGLYTLHGFLRALVWAGVFAIATWPLYRRAVARFGTGRHNLALPSLFTLAITLLFVVPLVLVAMQLGAEARHLLGMVAEARRDGIPVPDWVGHLPLAGAAAATWWHANLADPAAAEALLGRIEGGDLMGFARELGTQAAHRAVLFGFTLLALFFLFRDGPELLAELRTGSRRLFGPRGEAIGQQIIASVHGTVDGLVLVGIGEGVLIGIGYAVAGVPHAGLLGALTAVAAMIPFGAPLVFGAASLVLLAQERTVAAIALFAFGFVVAFIADHAIRPVLIGGATRLPFLWVLLGILGGVETFGLLGLFLGPAIMAVLILLWREWTGPAPT